MSQEALPDRLVMAVTRKGGVHEMVGMLCAHTTLTSIRLTTDPESISTVEKKRQGEKL